MNQLIHSCKINYCLRPDFWQFSGFMDDPDLIFTTRKHIHVVLIMYICLISTNKNCSCSPCPRSLSLSIKIWDLAGLNVGLKLETKIPSLSLSLNIWNSNSKSLSQSQCEKSGLMRPSKSPPQFFFRLVVIFVHELVFLYWHCVLSIVW